MTDPAIGYLPGAGYGPFDRGTADDIWVKDAHGNLSLGVVWPGMSHLRLMTVFFLTVA